MKLKLDLLEKNIFIRTNRERHLKSCLLHFNINEKQTQPNMM